MNQQAAKTILDQTIGQVFGYQNPLSLEQALQKFAFDVRLPQQVYDATTGQPTWTASMGDVQYLTLANAVERSKNGDNLRDYQKMTSVEDVMNAWTSVNYAMTEREIASKNVAESDGVYHSENIYRSLDIRKSKNILFSDGVDECDHIVAGQTSKKSQYCVRVEDSKNISSSFNVIWSNKITSSFFIRDCYDLVDCMFCTHLAGKKFCVANIQLEEAEYKALRDKIVRWILQG